jgi:hypothetical protein
MAFAQRPTFADAAGVVLKRCGESSPSSDTLALVVSFLDRADRELYEDAEWSHLRVRTTRVLPALATVLEVPDDLNTGHLYEVQAYDATKPTVIWDLEGGIDSDDRATWALNVSLATVYAPCKYQLVNGVIEVGPAPQVDITIVFAYTAAPPAIRDENARLSCEPECVMQAAEILYRNHLQGAFAMAIPVLKMALNRHQENIKRKQGGVMRAAWTPGEKSELIDRAAKRFPRWLGRWR